MAIQRFNAVGGYSTGLTATAVIDANGNITSPNIVNAVNGKTGGITFASGTGITFITSGNTITIASTGGGGAAANTTTQTLDFSESINGVEFIVYGSGLDLATSLENIENYTTIVVSLNIAGDLYNCVLDSIKSFYDPINGWSARLVVKAPFIMIGNPNFTYSAETAIADSINTINLDLTSSSGNNVVDYWQTTFTASLYHQEETYTTLTVTGQTWVAADSYIECKVLGLTTADHTPEDAILEGVKFEINNIVAGTGFDIIGHAPEGTYGKYTVKCLGQ